ncbi:MAG TPA: enoyl-CoA hydratase-related protein [bacterium]|nr:enoyl-CoA hydratase-related protein [bacterium]
MTDVLRVMRDGPVATVVLNRPEKHNAITAEMWRTLPGVLQELDHDGGVRVLVLRGAGQAAFAAGADISEFTRLRAAATTAREYSTLVDAAERALASFPRPTIALIHGFCVGGGLELALACDVRWASRTSRFGITAARLGIIYSALATRRLASIVGPSHARDLLYSGRLVDAGDARAMGLVNMVCEPEVLEAETYGYARLLAEQAPLSQRGAKLMLQHLVGEGGMTESELAAFVERSYESEDYKEGVRAFLAGRLPRFRGQ